MYEFLRKRLEKSLNKRLEKGFSKTEKADLNGEHGPALRRFRSGLYHHVVEEMLSPHNDGAHLDLATGLGFLPIVLRLQGVRRQIVGVDINRQILRHTVSHDVKDILGPQAARLTGRRSWTGERLEPLTVKPVYHYPKEPFREQDRIHFVLGDIRQREVLESLLHKTPITSGSFLFPEIDHASTWQAPFPMKQSPIEHENAIPALLKDMISSAHELMAELLHQGGIFVIGDELGVRLPSGSDIRDELSKTGERALFEDDLRHYMLPQPYERYWDQNAINILTHADDAVAKPIHTTIPTSAGTEALPAGTYPNFSVAKIIFIQRLVRNGVAFQEAA